MNVLLLLLFITPSLSALRWDLMVASEDHLEALNEDGAVHAFRAQKPFGTLMGLALDARSQRVFFSSQNDESASIFEFSYAKENSTFLPVVSRQNDPVLGLAYDSISSTLFWTTGQSIMMLKMNETKSNRKNLSGGQTFLRFKQEKPLGIFVDSCGGYVYWTNSNSNEPSIERARINGKDHKKIITKGLLRPHSITVDANERRIYWGNELEDIFFVIESANLDGTDRQTLVRSVNNKPFSIAVNKDQVFWADWTNEAVWSVEKNGNKNDPKRLYTMQARQPMGMVTNARDTPTSELECKAVLEAARKREGETTTVSPADTTTDTALGEPADSEDVAVDDRIAQQYCLNGGASSKNNNGLTICRCLPGFTGARCDVDLCHNLCVNGECEVNSTGVAVCKCKPGYSGSRCEINACSGYCLNDGCCKLENGHPKCKCSPPFSGSRCELNAGYSKLCRLYCETKRDSVSLDDEEEHLPCHCEEQGLSHYEYKVDGESHRWKHEEDEKPLFSNASLALTATLAALCVFLLLCVLYLVRRVVILRKRPRIKRQFIGNKPPVNPTPLTDRPTQASDFCEISIENCCNMNICETPCFEPNLRTVRPGSKKEEKKTLLASMEQGGGPADDLY